ncbi:hypothetical protein KY284_005134 [Solanum tuberosum]|nr:hypothetical protein KY284_005134 [Solanum tuberosum]
MAKTRVGIVKRLVPKPSKNKKRKAEEVSRCSKKKKTVVEEPKSNSDSDTMAEINNYEDSSALATDDGESTKENTDSGDESSSGDSRDTGDEDDDPLSLPTCARKISEFALITGLNCLAYPRDAKMKKELQKVKYLKNKINLKKQSEVYKERGNAPYALYGFPWAFLVWIYETFPYLGNYAKKSLDSPLPILYLLRWHTAKSDNIVEGDPFKYQGKSTKVVHPYLVPIVRETKQNYMATLKAYTNEVKDKIIDALKANLKGVTVLSSAVENREDEILGENNSNQPCENFVLSGQKKK